MADRPLPAALSPDRLYRACDPKSLGFETTAELKDGAEILGQERALEAIRFGASIDRPGFNLFVLGAPGTGRHTTINRLLAERAAARPCPDDWAYVNNFETPYQPTALRMPCGRGAQLRDALDALIDDIRAAIPAAFESEEYQARREAIDQEAQQHQQSALAEVERKAEAKNIAIVRTPMGFALAPVRDGQVVRPDVFEALPEEERERIQGDIAELEQELSEVIKQAPRWQKERRDALRKLNEEVTEATIAGPIADLKQSFEDLPEVLAHLDAVRSDLIRNVHRILVAERTAAQQADGTAVDLDPAAAAKGLIGGFSRYEVNLIVSTEDGDGAPVVYEDHPTLANLVGRIEHISQLGALVTNFSLIKPGALHRANGGYLILDVIKVLTQPYAWEMLKRSLKARCISIESPAQAMGVISTVSLDPQPIPLEVKVVLCGEPLHYYLLSAYDPEFRAMFKVAADFDDIMQRDEGAEAGFARMIAESARREHLRPFHRDAVARVIEQAARFASDAEKLSIELHHTADLMAEADHHAAEAGAEVVSADHVEAAIAARIRRADRLRARSLEAIDRDIILIDTTDAKVGQINGLSVLQLGDFAFGRPTRITARVRIGTGRVIDIEREVELGGPLHSKGVMILAGYLGAQFSADSPLSLAATLVFEQSYGGVDGDSASTAELYALLSALAEVPIRQSLAVTGSVNQRGAVQAIGGVNEKIEGFFDVCNKRGLTGDQGVLIPVANTKHLMLRPDVIEAVRAGRFHIYPVATVEEGIGLLTGLEAGERGADGHYPEASLYGRVERRLQSFAEARSQFGRAGAEPAESAESAP